MYLSNMKNVASKWKILTGIYDHATTNADSIKTMYENRRDLLRCLCIKFTLIFVVYLDKMGFVGEF